jgi:hypothetical protein
MEERQSRRKVVDSVLRIQFEPNNEALVLNFSDGGIGFRAQKPVTQSGTVHFSYLNNGQRMQGSGQLVWMDSTTLTGGLNFVSAPLISREQFQNWVAQSLKESMLPGNEASPRRAADDSDRVSPNFSPRETANPGFAMPMDEPQRATSEWDREFRYPGLSSRFFPGFVTGVVVTAIALVVLFFFYGNSADAVRDQFRQSARLSPTQQMAPPVIPAAPTPPPTVTSPPSATGVTASPETSVLTPSAPLPNSGDNSGANATIPTAGVQKSQTQSDNQKPGISSNSPPKAVAAGDDNLALAQRYLATMPGPEGREKATQYLWLAVEKGNLKAEITLADLYARGDGVTKNCVQARVLLRAAAEKGSAEASNQLAHIIRTGCS